MNNDYVYGDSRLQKPEPRAKTKARAKREQTKADALVYQSVTERDKGVCRCCRSASNIERHHLIPRSLQGPTTTRNVLLLCRECHRAWHDRRLFIDGDDANKGMFFQWRSR